jgi:hypothetical protein
MSTPPAAQSAPEAPLAQGRRLLSRYWIWVVPLNLLFMALDGPLGGPFFPERTGAGRFERDPHALLLAAFVAACTFYITSGLLRGRIRTGLMVLLCAALGALDAWYAMTAFGASMFLLMVVIPKK